MTSLTEFLDSCGAEVPPKSACEWNAQVNAGIAGRLSPILARTVPITTFAAIKNPSVQVGFRGDEALVKVGGAHAWLDVLFVKGEAQEVHIGNAGMSGIGTYAPDPSLTGALAQVAKSRVQRDGVVDFKGDALASLTKLVGVPSRFGSSPMAPGYENLCTSRQEGHVNALAQIHATLGRKGLATIPYAMLAPKATSAAPKKKLEKA